MPKDIQLDLFNGKAWISVIAFTREKRRIRRLPSVPGISDFYEINVRTITRHCFLFNLLVLCVALPI
ncbi:MAG: DUF2071 domain-containing protein [Chitinophagaceae bacterium]